MHIKAFVFFVSKHVYLEFVASFKEGKGLMIIKTLIQGEYEQYEDKKEQIEQDIRDQLRAKNILPLECSVAVRTTFEFLFFRI